MSKFEWLVSELNKISESEFAKFENKPFHEIKREWISKSEALTLNSKDELIKSFASVGRIDIKTGENENENIAFVISCPIDLKNRFSKKKIINQIYKELNSLKSDMDLVAEGIISNVNAKEVKQSNIRCDFTARFGTFFKRYLLVFETNLYIIKKNED